MGGRSAVQMAIYDGQLSWQVTGIFVQFAFLTIAGAIFPSFVGSEDYRIIAIAGLAVSVAGIIMTSMFGSMVMRERTYEEYWNSCAKQLESCMIDKVKTIEGSMVLSKLGNITIEGKPIRMRRISAIKSKMMLGALFIFFLIVFICLFIINLWRLVLAL